MNFAQTILKSGAAGALKMLSLEEPHFPRLWTFLSPFCWWLLWFFSWIAFPIGRPGRRFLYIPIFLSEKIRFAKLPFIAKLGIGFAMGSMYALPKLFQEKEAP